MDKLDGFNNIFSTKFKDAYLIRQNRKIYLLPCEIVDEYKVYQILPNGEKIRSHSLEAWKYTKNWKDAEKYILEEAKNN